MHCQGMDTVVLSWRRRKQARARAEAEMMATLTLRCGMGMEHASANPRHPTTAVAETTQS